MCSNTTQLKGVVAVAICGPLSSVNVSIIEDYRSSLSSSALSSVKHSTAISKFSLQSCILICVSLTARRILTVTAACHEVVFLPLPKWHLVTEVGLRKAGDPWA